jgi:hypothetical protein
MHELVLEHFEHSLPLARREDDHRDGFDRRAADREMSRRTVADGRVLFPVAEQEHAAHAGWIITVRNDARSYCDVRALELEREVFELVVVEIALDDEVPRTSFLPRAPRRRRRVRAAETEPGKQHENPEPSRHRVAIVVRRAAPTKTRGITAHRHPNEVPEPALDEGAGIGLGGRHYEGAGAVIAFSL